MIKKDTLGVVPSPNHLSLIPLYKTRKYVRPTNRERSFYLHRYSNQRMLENQITTVQSNVSPVKTMMCTVTHTPIQENPSRKLTLKSMSTTRDRLHPHRRKNPPLLRALQRRLEYSVQSRELCGSKQSLTLHKTSVENKLRQWLLTTNIMENINRMMKEQLRRIRHWVNSDQCQC